MTHPSELLIIHMLRFIRELLNDPDFIANAQHMDTIAALIVQLEEKVTE
jgi:hypothetical protein